MKISSFFDSPTINWRSFKCFCEIEPKPHFNGWFFQISQISRSFGLIELHNLSKGQLADRIFKLWKRCVHITWSSNIQLLKFWLFNFSNFQTSFVKNFMKKLPGFKTDFESSDKVLLLHQYIWSEISRQWNNSPSNFF